MNLNPSPEWRPDERIEVAASLADQLHDEAAKGFISTERILDYSERINFVLTQRTSLLEINRKGILEGRTPGQSSKEAGLG